MVTPKRIVKWTGTASWTAGQQSTTKWLTAGTWISKGELGNLVTAASAPTLDSQGMLVDIDSRERVAFFCYAKKTAHAESVTFATRLVHAWVGPTPDLMSPITLRPGAGHYPPFLYNPTDGAVANLLTWNTNQGGIISAMALNAYNVGVMPMFANLQMTQGLGAFGCVRVVVELATGATVLAGTNTWDVTAGFILG